MKDKKKVKDTWNAPKYFLTVVFIFFLVFAGQLTYITLSPTIYGINMDKFAESRNTYSETLYAKRGTIFDSSNNVLAQNVASYTVIAYLNPKRTINPKNPQHVVDKEATAKALAPILNMTEERLKELLSKSVYQVELGPGGRGITELTKMEIASLKLPGIDFVETYKRYYPNGKFASYIIGYAKLYEETKGNVTTDKIVGELGLESKYNDYLTGKNGYLKYQQDRFGYKIPDTLEEREDAVDGYDIYLTLDSNIQRFAESAIESMKKNTNPSWAAISVMNAKTGDILAAATIPSFDPNIRDVTNYQSPLVTTAYEPGSVMKIYSYLCAVDSNKYDGNMTVQSGSIKVGDDEVRDWNRIGWGTITLNQGLLYSSNVAASTLVQKVITKNELQDCYERLGFGDLTGVELASEVAGKITFNYPIEVATASFGQGITTTVVQQLKAVSVLANDGKTVSPHIVKKILDKNTNKIVYESSVEKSEKIFKTSTVNYVKDLLYQSINGDDYNATGRIYRMDGYKLLGKTGTAQIPSPKKGYLTGDLDYLRSFIGMYPANDPEIIIYVTVKQATSAYASRDAVKEMVTNITKYLNLFDDGTISSNIDMITLKSYANSTFDKAKDELSSHKINVVKIGDGDTVISQYPLKGSVVLSNEKVFLITNSKSYKMPNLKGYSLKDAKQLLTILGLKIKTSGTGYVTEQSISEGTEINKGDEITITLSDKFDFSKIG